MNSKERILAALHGEPVDRLPWCPFLAYWWEHQPKSRQEQGQIAFLREIGADALLRGFVQPFTVTYGGEIQQETRQSDGISWFIQHTPVGDLRTGSQYSPDGDTTYVVHHPIQRREDYRALRALVTAMELRPQFEPVQQQIEAVGEDGLCVPLISPFGKTPFQALLEHYVGTEQLVYHLMDMPEEVEATLALMNEKCIQAVYLAADSPAEVFITWEDSSTTNVSPRLFTKYIASQMNRWGELLEQTGKALIHHACGHLKALLPIMAQENIVAIESISPPPTGNVELWEAREIVGPELCLIGGIEPVHFLTLEDDAFEVYVRELIERMPRKAFILANSDSCPPGVPEERFRRVGEIVKETSD
ncbi:MAG: uroporphyrinogen decarboxylase family protein [Anaerolineae bacterium]|jgi:uroporphyrinogen-III decarboxylase|nr:uroporphyrinogen decarboxylase family protein [Anaerolineae bacterium]